MRIPPKAVSMAVPDTRGKEGGVTAGDRGWTDRISGGNPLNVSVTDSAHK